MRSTPHETRDASAGGHARATCGVRSVGVDVSDLQLPGLEALPRDNEGCVAPLELHAFLISLRAEDLETDYESLDLVAAWDRFGSWVAAQQLAAVAEFARRPDVLGADPAVARAMRRAPGQVAREHPDDEVGVRLRVSRAAASIKVDLAVHLADGFAPTAAALASGRIDLGRARLIVAECSQLDAEALPAMQAKALALAVDRSAPRLRPMLQRAVLAIDPDAARRRCQAERDEARVVVTPNADATSQLWAQLPAEDAAAIETVIDASARRMRAADDDQGRHTLDWWRAKALAAPFVDALQTGVLHAETLIRLPRSGRRAARIHVTVPASVLLGLSEAPGEMRGHGPIPAFLARALAADATWQRVLTDDDGRVVRVDPTVYRPGAVDAATVRARDQLCRFPGCGANSQRCHLDHVVPFPAGPTDPSNLATECQRHHRVKHRRPDLDREPEGALALSRTQPPHPVLTRGERGELVWTMPTGHRHVSRAPVVAEPADDAALVDAVRAIAASGRPESMSVPEQELSRRVLALAA